MSLACGARLSSFLRSGKHLQIGWVITAVVVAFYAGVVRPRERYIGINNSKASGLAALEERTEPLGLWHQTRIAGMLAGQDVDKAITTANYIPNAVPAPPDSGDAEAGRKMVRTATLEVLVQHPADTAEKIRLLAEQEGGFLVSSEVLGW